MPDLDNEGTLTVSNHLPQTNLPAPSQPNLPSSQVIRSTHFSYRFHDPSLAWLGHRRAHQSNEYRRFDSNRSSLHQFRQH
ncbi:MAG: hypothetical protein LQ346_009077, partial [Caloplaca aetnensis]